MPRSQLLLLLQGFVACEPELLGMEEVPLHLAIKAIPAKVRFIGGTGCLSATVCCLCGAAAAFFSDYCPACVLPAPLPY